MTLSEVGLEFHVVSRLSYFVHSFLTGVARLVDFGGFINSRSARERARPDADARAIYSDWLAVGNDIRRAARTFDKKIKP